MRRSVGIGPAPGMEARWNATREDRDFDREMRLEQHRLDQRRAEDMARQIKSPTGIVRRQPNLDPAGSAVDSANKSVNDALDRVREAFDREAQLNRAESENTRDAARRAPSMRQAQR